MSCAGVEESPLMTWGEIEGTPFRLDAGDTPLAARTPGPVFKIPEMPERQRLALELAEKASKTHRKKKEDAIKSVAARLSSYVACCKSYLKNLVGSDILVSHV
jgi:protein DGCR14